MNETITELIYEATRQEAEWSGRTIVPEKWDKRDEKFKTQMINIISDYMNRDVLPTPEEAHNSWMQAYFDMGWTYGETRDIEKKTHPDLVPYNDLSQDEKDKDAIFLAFVALAKGIVSLVGKK